MSHVAPFDCVTPKSIVNECPICGAEYYDLGIDDE